MTKLAKCFLNISVTSAERLLSLARNTAIGKRTFGSKNVTALDSLYRNISVAIR